MIRRVWKWARGVFYRGSHRTAIRPITDPPAPAPDSAANHEEPAGAGDQRPTQEDVSRWIAKLGPQPEDLAYDLPPIPGRYMPSAHVVLGALGQRQWP